MAVAQKAHGVSPYSASGALISVAIEHVQPSALNPRTTRNVNYDSLRASIEAAGGLDGPLAVIKRPGDTCYSLEQGGNTRLKILKSLHEENPVDPRWQTVQVVVREFLSDMDVLAKHIRENTCRGDLRFYELARAKVELFTLWQERQPPSRRRAKQFLSEMRERYGDTTTEEAFSRMKFTVERLAPCIPHMLAYGPIHLKAVRNLLKWRNAVKAVWLDKGAGDEREFYQAFYAHLGRQDKQLAYRFPRSSISTLPDNRFVIDYERLQSDLANEISISETIDASFNRVNIWLCAALGKRGEITSAAAPVRVLPAPASTQSVGNDQRKLPLMRALPGGKSAEQSHQQRKVTDTSQIALPGLVNLLSDDNYSHEENDLAPLANDLATRYGFGDLIQRVDDELGFTITDQLDDERLQNRSSLAAWWVIATASKAFGLSSDASVAKLPEGSFLRTALESDQIELLDQIMNIRSSIDILSLLSHLPAEDADRALFLLRKCLAKIGTA